MKEKEWAPRDLADSEIDWAARRIGSELKQTLPPSHREAVKKYGPLLITHVHLRPVEEGMWVPMTFISSLSRRQDVFFVGFGYMMPYFKRWVDYMLVQEGGFRPLPNPIVLEGLKKEKRLWLGPEGGIFLADRNNNKNSPVFDPTKERVCSMFEL